MSYQLIALDLDGTLLNSRKQIPPEAVQAIRTVCAAGKTVVFDTGRAVCELEEQIAARDAVLDGMSKSLRSRASGQTANYHRMLNKMERFVKSPNEPSEEEKKALIRSIGDYVLTGGELPAMVICESLMRLVDGSMKKESVLEESFEEDLLEYPQYTRPFEYKGERVPEILLSGDHEAIAKWRKEEALKLTKERRPDLLKKDEE